MKDCLYILNGTTYKLNEILDYINNNFDIIPQLNGEILLHEAIHPFIDEIYDRDEKSIKSIYNNFIKTKEGKQILAYVQLNYPYLSGKELIAEVLTRGVQQEVKQEREPKSWFVQLLNKIKEWLGISNDLSKFTTISDLARYLDESFQSKRERGITSFRRRSIDKLKNTIDTLKSIMNKTSSMKLVGMEEDSHYELNGVKFTRVSNFIKQLFSDTSYSYDEEEYIKNVAYATMRSFNVSGIFDENGKIIVNKSPEDVKNLAKAYNEWIETTNKTSKSGAKLEPVSVIIKGKTEEEKREKAINLSLLIHKNLMEYYRKDLEWKKNISLTGSAVHMGFEAIVRSMNNKLNFNITKEEIIKILDKELAEKEAYEITKGKKSKKFKEIPGFNEFKIQVADAFLNKVIPALKVIEIEPGFIQAIYPEFKVYDENLNGRSIAGTIDLLIVDKNGNAHIIDYKTSLRERDFWSKSKENAVTSQLMTYKYILEKSHGIEVKSALPIDLKLNVNHTHVNNREIISFKKMTIDENNLRLPKDIINTVQATKINKTLEINYGKPLLAKTELSVRNKPIREFMKKYFNYEFLTESEEEIEKQKGKKREKALTKGYFYNTIERRIIRKEEVRDFEEILNKYLDYIYSQKQEYGQILSNYIRLMKVHSLQKRFKSEQLPKEYQYKGTPLPEPSFDITNDYSDQEYRRLFNSTFSKYWSEFKATRIREGSEDKIVYEPVWVDVSTPESLELGIVMMMNTETGIVDILTLHPKANEDRDILNNTSFKSLPIFGQKITSGSIGGNFLNEEQDNMYNLMDASYGNIEAIKAYLFLINQNFNDGRKIGNIVSISNQAGSKPLIISLAKLDENVKKLIEVSGETTEMDDIIRKYNRYNHELNLVDKMREIYTFYQTRFDYFSTESQRNLFRSKMKSAFGIDSKFMPSVKTVDITPNKIKAFYGEIITRQQELERQRMSGNLMEDELYELKLLNELILTLGNIELIVDESDITRMSKNIIQPDEIRSPMFQTIRTIILNMRQRFKLAYNKYFDKIRKEFTEYYKEKGKITSLTTSEHFRNLFEYEEVETPDGRVIIRNTFRLRDPDAPYDYRKFNQTELTTAERNLIRKMIENLRELRAGEELDNVRVRELPLVEKSASTKFAESIKKGNFKEALWAFKNSFNETILTQEEHERNISDTDIFKAKINSAMAYQKDPKNREKMLSEIPESNFETDIETLYLWMNYHENKTREWNKSLPQIMAARSMICMSNFVWHKNFPEVTELIDTFIRTTVFGKAGLKEEEEMLARNISTFKSAITLQQLGLSVRTSFIQTLSTIFSTLPILNGGIGSDKVTMKGILKAMRFVFNPENDEFLYQLRLKYNMDNMNVESMLYARKVQMTGMAWASNKMMWFNAIGDQKFREILFIAQMIQDGVIDIENGRVTENSAIYLTNNGLEYDPKKDKRYSSMDTDLDQKAMYEFRVKMAKEQGTYDYENEKPAIPYTFEEIRSKHKLLNDAYADMTSENRSMFEKSIWGLLFFQFRKWIQAKKNLYYTDFNNPIKTLSDAGEWVPVRDKDGNILRDENGDPIVRWQGRLHEGILNTLFKVFKSLIEDPTNIINNLKNLQDFQKRNLKHLANDLGLLLFLLLLKEIFSWEEKREDKDALDSLLSLTYRTMADSTFFAIVSDVSVNSPFVMISILKGAFEQIFGNLLEGDFAQSGESLLRSFGISRSIMQIYEVVYPED